MTIIAPPSVRAAFVLRIIDDAMKMARYNASKPEPDGTVQYWPMPPDTRTVRISVTADDAAAHDLLALAQRKVDEALAG